jgi:hypothetical protein
MLALGGELEMTPSKSASRPASVVSAALDRRLIAYSVGAAAAGMSVLIASKTAQAEIVYTPANVAVLPIGIMPIDINNDGTPDFVIRLDRCSYQNNCLVINPLLEGNGIRGFDARASAGFSGFPVGPQQRFLTQFRKFSWSQSAGSYVAFMVDAGAYGGGSWSGGPWANTTNRYLGLKFLINGEVHYGWARMSIRVMRDKIRLTGYAYETIPNKQIIEGQTEGTETSTIAPANILAPASQQAGLGALARGAEALSIWRREDEVFVGK